MNFRSKPSPVGISISSDMIEYQRTDIAIITTSDALSTKANNHHFSLNPIFIRPKDP